MQGRLSARSAASYLLFRIRMYARGKEEKRRAEKEGRAQMCNRGRLCLFAFRVFRRESEPPVGISASGRRLVCFVYGRWFVFVWLVRSSLCGPVVPGETLSAALQLAFFVRYLCLCLLLSKCFGSAEHVCALVWHGGGCLVLVCVFFPGVLISCVCCEF